VVTPPGSGTVERISPVAFGAHWAMASLSATSPADPMSCSLALGVTLPTTDTSTTFPLMRRVTSLPIGGVSPVAATSCSPTGSVPSRHWRGPSVTPVTGMVE